MSSTPRSCGIWDCNDTRLEPLDKTRTGPDGVREDLEGVKMGNISWTVGSVACFGVCVFVGATVALSYIWYGS